MMWKAIVEFCRKNRRMLYSFLLVWVCLLVFDCIYPKIQTHLMLNGYHAPFLDAFFRYVTWMGEEFPVYVGVAFLIWNVNSVWNRRNGLFILLSQGLTCILTQVLKFAFAHPRPATYFSQMGVDLPETVEGVTLRRAMNSFPSGHTSAAFALFVCMALVTPRKWAPLWITAAWAVAYSRIYLSQHFLEDILLGSVIGVVSSCAVFMLMEYYTNKKRLTS
jgi:membrane-associated phospholipid phosphatase